MLYSLRKKLGKVKMDRNDRKHDNFIHNSSLFEDESNHATLIRLTHSIEKGLSIENPRLGFGFDKIKVVFGLAKGFIDKRKCDKYGVLMARDAIIEYCEYHDSLGFKSEKLEEIHSFAEFLKANTPSDGKKYGGTKEVEKGELSFDEGEVERFFGTRHSIRAFEKGEVDTELIKKAVHLAQTAPSACNRQAVRVYAVSADKFIKDTNSNLEGIGGFAKDVDKFLLICGKTSDYTEFEYKQFVVSAGIFAGYLSLSLHAFGIGGCVVQRSIRSTPEWRGFCEKTGIPLDEQIICMMGIGNMKDRERVPFSYRFPTEEIFKVI